MVGVTFRSSEERAAPPEAGPILIVRQDCALAGLREGEWMFASLRTGFIRTAIRAVAPERVVARHAGLAAFHSVRTHASREMLVRDSAAWLVGL